MQGKVTGKPVGAAVSRRRVKDRPREAAGKRKAKVRSAKGKQTAHRRLAGNKRGGNGLVSESIGQMYLPAIAPTLRKTKAERETAEWGTFKDSLRAPIHNWFTYPAGFSYKAVESSLRSVGCVDGDFVYDPFMGSGTTNLTAKKMGISSYGVEAHPFVFRIARAKLNWEISRAEVRTALAGIERTVEEKRGRLGGDGRERLREEFPPLVLKCYEDRTLLDLLFVRDAISAQALRPTLVDFLQVGLAGLLRQVSSAATGWPYIAPNKKKTTSAGKDALAEYCGHVFRMVGDIETTVRESGGEHLHSTHHLCNGDSRNTAGFVPDNCIDHIFTSPPYLNNFDYADRTRLELYFFGEAKTWDDISRNVRAKLITSATTQISRDDPRYELSGDLRQACPKVYDFLSETVETLGRVRLTKGGKKSYDHLVAGYFNDLYLVLKDNLRVLKNGRQAVFVLGDSAPYGVYVPTDELIGKIAVGLGFSSYTLRVLRTRGDKWKKNPMRHNVKLRESIVTLAK